MQRGLDAGLGAAGVDDDVGAAGERGVLFDVGGVGLGGDALAEVGVRGAEGAREVELGLHDVDGDDGRGAEGGRHGGAEQADGPGAHHDHGLPRGNGGLPDDVHGDGEGLDQRALLQGDGLGELVAEVGGGGPEAGQCSVIGGRRGEPHLRAEVVVAAEAGGAAAAGVAGLEGDAVAGAEGGDGGADLDDGAGGLVAEDHGVLDDEVPDGAVLPVVHVGAADAGVVHGDEDVVGGLQGGEGAGGEVHVMGLVEDEGEVLGGWVLEGGLVKGGFRGGR